MSLYRKIESVFFTIVKYFSLCFAAFCAVIPVLVCVSTALKSSEEYGQTNVMQLPQVLQWDNFVYVFQKANMLTAFKNSFIVLVIVVCGSIMISAMLAYVLNRFKFFGNNIIRNLFLFATLIPGIATQVTVYQIMYKAGLVNTLHGYMIMMLGTDVISIYIFLQFFENLPVCLDESARIDGANYFQIFYKILFPLLKPAIITSMILKGVGTYNEYYMANLYLQDKNNLVTAATSLYTFTGPLGNQYNYICGGDLITLLPALIVFICCQKQIYSGLAQGAVKG